MKTFRDVERIIKGQATSDGDGVKLTRLLTQDLQKRLDPFLMLDAFGSDEATDYVGGFPDHPHRGFETVTYMLEGKMRHQDSAGNTGLLEDGGVQWMTAGKGVIHSEMPEQKEGRMSGFQLWLNLPSHQKMCSPWYKDIQRNEIPEKTLPNGITIRVIAGESLNTLGAVQREVTQPLFLDIHFPEDKSSSFEQFIASEHNAFLYVYHGEVSVDGQSKIQAVRSKEMAILSNKAEFVAITANAKTKLILISGAPLKENIVQYGPFVMNTKEEIIKAVEDFRNGEFA
jgi:redox-sensitive bicupin YhaK (pirin superfamily)